MWDAIARLGLIFHAGYMRVKAAFLRWQIRRLERWYREERQRNLDLATKAAYDQIAKDKERQFAEKSTEDHIRDLRDRYERGEL